ncbi:GtrA family protein [Anaerorhabdus furcosa]|uniref:Putative flippase GtrA (Transmembrane translocase of bactoprenol-linked glucose) n=1 Tax=Anaerorhabdus furcosa TaxID=118967 RepID=A0A1T4LUG9_9FIRM|nr:GtrA family protein [Anaerorhabdus furcosa]SJZ58363.1 Putative flippase GtrA (transmembrane translocase of bactoprenol-linked glucose) [Anaerorhabdus furcosa]
MWNKIKNKFFNKQFLTFGLIGGFNTIGSQILYIVFVNMSIAPSISSFFGDAITMVISYFMNMKYTYHEKCTWKNAITFPISYLPGIIINMLIVALVVWLGIPKIYAKLFSLPITIPVNYICMSIIVKLTGTKENSKID